MISLSVPLGPVPRHSRPPGASLARRAIETPRASGARRAIVRIADLADPSWPGWHLIVLLLVAALALNVHTIGANGVRFATVPASDGWVA